MVFIQCLWVSYNLPTKVVCIWGTEEKALWRFTFNHGEAHVDYKEGEN